MPLYSFKCKKCEYAEDGKIFSAFKDFEKHKCPECKGEIQQVYDTFRFKIKGYSHNNEYNPKSYYKGIGTEKKKSYSIG